MWTLIGINVFKMYSFPHFYNNKTRALQPIFAELEEEEEKEEKKEEEEELLKRHS